MPLTADEKTNIRANIATMKAMLDQADAQLDANTAFGIALIGEATKFGVNALASASRAAAN